MAPGKEATFYQQHLDEGQFYSDRQYQVNH